MAKQNRPDRNGTHRSQFEKNKKKIYMTQDVCGICGRPVDKSLNYRDPLSKCIDHIVPVSKGGHPSDISNMQLAHRTCNRKKGDSLPDQKKITSEAKIDEVISNRILPQSTNWKNYTPGNK